MNHLNQPPILRLRASLLTGVIGAALAAACLNDSPSGFSDESDAGAAGNTTSSAGSASGGNNATGAAGNGTAAASPAEAGGGAGSSGSSSTAGSTATPGDGGTASVAAEGGAGGTGEPDGVHIGDACTFHTDAPAADGAAGAGGEGPVPNVVAQLSPFVGSYLTDAAGRTLYTYGADLPGDCETPPQSTCVVDCLVSWPAFDAGDRVLGAGLNDAGFGVIERPEGGFQTTYMGWPLYYYKSDLSLGQMTGQGKGKIWHVAEVNLPSIVIMKSGMLKYLADGDGRTLYVSAADQAGSAEADPISNCQGECLQTFEGFHLKNISLVTSLESSDFQVFVRHGAGGLQLAYKGMPLYRAATDLKSGDMNGTALAGFTAAVP